MDLTADVIILGAGAAGLSAADRLLREGLRVIVAEGVKAFAFQEALGAAKPPDRSVSGGSRRTPRASASSGFFRLLP